MRTPTQRPAPWLVLSAAFVASPALAEDLGELEGLLERNVVTSASKSAETASSAPATAVTIPADDLERHGIRTLDQALLFLGYGVTTGERRQPGEFGARGVKLTPDLNSHVLILIDGHSMNSQLSGGIAIDRGLGLPIELVDHIELILGPGSVLYGTNAMLAVVNVVTKRAKDFAGLHVGVETELPTLQRGSVGAGTEFSLFGEDAELTLGLEASRYHEPLTIPNEYEGVDAYTGQPLRFSPDGPADGIWGGTWDNNDHLQAGGYSRLLVGGFELMLGAATIDRSNPHLQFDFDNPDQRERNRWVFADARYHSVLSGTTDLSARVYADSERTDLLWRASAAQYCLPGQINGCRMDNVGGSEWVGSEVQTRIDWVQDGTAVTMIGLDGRVRHTALVIDLVDIETGDNPGSAAYDDRVDTLLGVYGQQELELHPSILVNGGARLDVDSRFGSAVSPRAALVLLPWEGGTVKGIYSSAFRTPSPTEAGAAQPMLIVRADDLGPERVRSVEGVIEQRFGTHRLLTALFRSQWDDMVVLDRLTEAELAAAQARGELALFAPRAYQYRNAAQIENYGINFGYEGALVERRLRYALNLTAAYARQSSAVGGDDEPLPESPHAFGNARISYDLSGPWPALGLAARYKSRQAIFNLQQDGYPNEQQAPPRLAFQVNVGGPAPGLEGLKYRLGVRFATSGESAAAIGPVTRATAQNPDPTLVPIETFRVLAGLQYDLEL